MEGPADPASPSWVKGGLQEAGGVSRGLRGSPRPCSAATGKPRFGCTSQNLCSPRHAGNVSAPLPHPSPAGNLPPGGAPPTRGTPATHGGHLPAGGTIFQLRVLRAPRQAGRRRPRVTRARQVPARLLHPLLPGKGIWDPPHLPEEEDDEPQQQQPGCHRHQHQPERDLGRLLLLQLRVHVHGELGGGGKSLVGARTSSGPSPAQSAPVRGSGVAHPHRVVPHGDGGDLRAQEQRGRARHLHPVKVPELLGMQGGTGVRDRDTGGQGHGDDGEGHADDNTWMREGKDTDDDDGDMDDGGHTDGGGHG